MAPVPTEQVTDLLKRYYTYGYNNHRTYRPWWVVFCVVIPVLILLFLCFAFRRRNFKRKSQGMQPVPYTGWTTYQWNGEHNNNNNQQQQPYYKPEGGAQYDYNNQSTYNQPPNYYQTTGGNETSGANGATQYQRPEGPPPGHNDPTYPQNAYTKS